MQRHRICEACGKPFVASRSDATVCSPAHRALKNRNLDALPVRIRAVKNALSALVETARTESVEWWDLTIRDLLNHVSTHDERLAASELDHDESGEDTRA